MPRCMTLRIAHHAHGSRAVAIRPFTQDGQSPYCAWPHNGATTAATYAAAGGTRQDLTSRNTPAPDTSTRVTFTAVTSTSTFGAREVSTPIVIVNGLNNPHWPSATAFPARQDCTSRSGKLPWRTCLPSSYHQPRYAVCVSPE